MDSVINNFEDRVVELNEHLQLLGYLSDPRASIVLNAKSSKCISNVALKTMKASCFLMLYNLVESSIRGSMTNLYESINASNGELIGFQDYVKEVWLKQHFKKIDPISSNQATYQNILVDIVESILTGSSVALDPKKVPISGNLDARKIRELFQSHNIPFNTHYRAFKGAELKTVKDKRNSLAHGDISFAECGREYTVSEIENIKKQTVVFIRSSLKNVKKHIEKKSYAA